ncbi:MAG: glycosyltransferase family 4 protein [Rubricoccaceae bacterium]
MENVFSGLARGLRARGHHVVEIWNGAKEQTAEGAVCNLRLHTPRSWKRVPTPVSLVRCAGSAVALAKVLKDVRPEVVNFHFLSAECLYPIALRPLFGYGTVLSAHGSDLMRPANALDRALVPYALRRADAVTVVSASLASRCREMSGGRGPEPFIISNGVDLAQWSISGPRRLARPVILSVGRLTAVKGQDVLVEAFAEVLRRRPDAELVLVGEGDTRGELERLSERLGVRERVTFAGKLNGEGIRKWMARAAVFALPSRSEGQPIALLEAMAGGLPAVATSVGGVPEILRRGGGVLVPPEAPEALANTLAAVLSDPELAGRLSHEAAVAARDYDWENTVSGYERVLSAVAAAR